MKTIDNIFLDRYDYILANRPDIKTTEHEYVLFESLFYEVTDDFGEEFFNSDEESRLKSLCWKMWQYGFAYDYPDDEDFERASHYYEKHKEQD